MLRYCFCVYICVCVVRKYFRAWQPNQKVFLGQYLREWGMYVSFFTLDCLCVSVLHRPCMLHIYALVRESAFSLQGANMKSICTLVMQLQLWLTSHVIRMPNSRLLKQILCSQWNEGKWAEGMLSSQCQMNLKKFNITAEKWGKVALCRHTWRTCLQEEDVLDDKDLHGATEGNPWKETSLAHTQILA